MRNKTILTSIDVGTTNVFTSIADVNGRDDVQIVGVGITPSQGLHKGLVVNINQAK